MKKIIAICILTALCLTMLVGCDMQGGLVAELFGKKDDDIYVVPPLPGDDVILIEPDVAYTEIWTEGIWTEDWTEEIEFTTPSQEIPEFAGMALVEIAIVDASGSYVPLYSLERLENWNGTIELDSSIWEDREAYLQIYGCVAYNQSDAVQYACGIPDSTAQRTLIEPEHAEIARSFNAEYVHGFYLSVPVSQLATGYNVLDLQAYAVEVAVDGPVMMQLLDVLVAEPELEDTAYPVPPEEMTEAPTEG